MDIHKLIYDEVDRQATERARIQRNMEILRSPLMFHALEKIAQLPSYDEIGNISFYAGFGMFDVNVYLKKDLKDPQLIRDLVRHGVVNRMDKKSAWTNAASLNAIGTLFKYNEDDDNEVTVRLEVYNYVPQTCRIEYEDVEVPAKIERRAKIICDPNDD